LFALQPLRGKDGDKSFGLLRSDQVYVEETHVAADHGLESTGSRMKRRGAHSQTKLGV
jgi:hypothetical protein